MLRSGTTNILIDSGSSDQKKLGSRTLEPCLKSKGISRLDIAVVSHGDSDHISGLLYLLEQKMPIDLLILPAGGKGGEIYGQLEQLQTEAGGKTYYMHQGDKIKAGEMEFTCIFEKETEEERNAHSLVLCSHYKDLHILLPVIWEYQKKQNFRSGRRKWQHPAGTFGTCTDPENCPSWF